MEHVQMLIIMKDTNLFEDDNIKKEFVNYL